MRQEVNHKLQMVEKDDIKKVKGSNESEQQHKVCDP
jgi:hypothetical protein